MLSSETSFHVIWKMFTDIVEERLASILIVKVVFCVVTPYSLVGYHLPIANLPV
jgi:hypothetical protein